MYSKDQINEWLNLNCDSDSDNDKSSELDYFNVSLKLKLVEAKILVDRWGNLTSDIVFHSSKKDFVREKLGSALTTKIVYSMEVDSIWGINIHYSDECPPDKGIMIDASGRAHTENARHISVFPM
jgi:hypothetical protein